MDDQNIKEGAQQREVCEKKKKRSAVDGGYGWVVVGACFVVHMFQVGYLRAFGLLFVKFLEEFKAPASVTSTIMGVQSAIFSLTSLLVLNVFIEYWSIRGYAMLGSAVTAIGVTISCFAPNVEYLIFSQSMFIGIGNAFSYGPGIVLIGRYFKKRLALANSIANAGVSAGAVVMPILISYLLEEYGLRGSLIVLGGVMSQVIVCAALYRSPEQSTDPDENLKVNPADFKSLESFYNLGEYASSKLDMRQDSVNSDADTDFRDRVNSNTPKIITNKFLFRERAYSNRSDKVHSESTPNPTELMNKHILRNQSVENGNSVNNRKRFISESNHAITTDIIESLSRSKMLMYASDPNLVYASVLDLKQGNKHAQTTAEEKPKTSFLSKLKNILDLSLFKNSMFWIAAGFTPLAMCGAALAGAFIPALAGEIGLNDSQASLLLTVSGAIDIVSRLVPGILSEFKILKKQYMVIIALSILGIVFQFSSYFDNFVLLMVFSSIYGLFGGVYFSLLAVIIIDLLGFENFPKAFGFVQVIHGAAAAICYPLLGLLKDLTGTYNTCFRFLGACMLGASIILALEPIARRRHNAKQKESNKTEYSKIPLNEPKQTEFNPDV
ncbi:monocarboxylate transporter 6 isoform X2 [Patella vulgata]|nr:monocarboxylate transporter 6 isoform X2 [Patella vulgata]